MQTPDQHFRSRLPLVPSEGGEGTGTLLLGYDFHPDEKNQRKIAEYIKAHSIPGVELFQFHPEAAAMGVRFLDEAQMSRYFPGNKNSSNREEAAAGRASEKIDDTDPWLIPVLHDSAAGNYALVGPRTTPAALGLACELGIHSVVIGCYPFERVVPRAINLEIDPKVEGLSNPHRLHEKMYHAANELRELGLQTSFEKQGHKLRYYQSLGTIMLNQIDPGIIRDIERLGLSPARFEPLELPAGLQFELVKQMQGEVMAEKIKSMGLKVAADTWGYGNFSKKLPSQGDGVVRREAFGALTVELGQPSEAEGIWLDFNDPFVEAA